MDTNFNADDLVEKGLVIKKTYKEGVFKGLSVYKYSRKVFFDNLWNLDGRLKDCRGIVVDENNKIISYPFTKVFNFLENNTKVDRDKKVVCVNKMNGFLATVKRHKGRLLISTTGSLDSDFAKLARKVIHNQIKVENLHNSLSYMFEICDPSDPHIIKEESGAYLIGIRSCALNSPMFSEYMLDATAASLNAKRPEWSIKRFSDILEDSKTCKHEGFMIRDPETWEIICKLKSRFYLQKKALQRVGKTKVNEMFDTPIKFKEKLDEEFYGLFDFLIDNFTKEEYLAFTEQERSELIFNYFEGNIK